MWHGHVHRAPCGQVRLYDEATKTLQSTLSGGLGYQRVGHSNRVFSLKFCSQDDHMLLSAGWDNTVQVLVLIVAIGMSRAPLHARST